MNPKMHGVVLECEQCQCVIRDESGGFEVTVPVVESETGRRGTARLHCVVSATQHRVELVEWTGSGPDPGDADEAMLQRVSKVLGVVAARRLCGNQNICPSEVVRIAGAFDDP